MRDARDGVALEDVVRAHARALERAEEGKHRLRRVVHPGEQHGLARDGDARAHEVAARLRRLRRHFARAVELRVHPHLAAAPEHRGEFARDARGIHARRARAEAHDVDLRETRERAHEAHDLVVGEDERVAARDEHVAHERMVLHVGEAGLQLLVRAHDLGAVEEALARAVAAVHEAAVARHHEHAVGEALLQSVAARRAVLLAEGVRIVAVVFELARIGIHLLRELRATRGERARIVAREGRISFGHVHRPFCWATREAAPYIRRSFGFSILPVGLRGTGAKMILRGRL